MARMSKNDSPSTQTIVPKEQNMNKVATTAGCQTTVTKPLSHDVKLKQYVKFDADQHDEDVKCESLQAVYQIITFWFMLLLILPAPINSAVPFFSESNTSIVTANRLNIYEGAEICLHPPQPIHMNRENNSEEQLYHSTIDIHNHYRQENGSSCPDMNDCDPEFNNVALLPHGSMCVVTSPIQHGNPGHLSDSGMNSATSNNVLPLPHRSPTYTADTQVVYCRSSVPLLNREVTHNRPSSIFDPIPVALSRGSATNTTAVSRGQSASNTEAVTRGQSATNTEAVTRGQRATSTAAVSEASCLPSTQLLTNLTMVTPGVISDSGYASNESDMSHVTLRFGSRESSFMTSPGETIGQVWKTIVEHVLWLLGHTSFDLYEVYETGISRRLDITDLVQAVGKGRIFNVIDTRNQAVQFHVFQRTL